MPAWVADDAGITCLQRQLGEMADGSCDALAVGVDTEWGRHLLLVGTAKLLVFHASIRPAKS